MSVYKKLMEARIELQNTKLKKTGINKFAKYEYFELSDFLPEVQKIFHKIGLAGVVSYGPESAKLTIMDTDTGENFDITTPMSTADLKGCAPVQGLGAVQTYLRRYLWVTAMEIVEHDALDGGNVEKEEKLQSMPAETVQATIAKLKESDTKEQIQKIWQDAFSECKLLGDTKSKDLIKNVVTAKIEEIDNQEEDIPQ